MKKVFTAVTLAAALIVPVGFSVPAQAAVKKYKTCAALQKAHPYGAGIKGSKDKVKTGFSPAKNFKNVSKSVYNASKKLDTDKDKILCEIPKYKNCTSMNKTYKHGIGLKGAKDKTTSTRKVTNFKVVSKALYETNKSSDRDKDKIACEKL